MYQFTAHASKKIPWNKKNPIKLIFRYVFQIYQEHPDPTVNFGLIVNEASILTGECAAWGDWNPPQLPICIRKYNQDPNN